MSKKELQAPDQIQATLERTWDRVTRYRKPLIGVVVFLFVGAIVVGTLTKGTRDAREAEATAFYQAMRPLSAPLEDEPGFKREDLPPEIEVFANRNAALEEARKRLTEHLDKHPDAPSRGAAELALVTTKLQPAEAAAAAAQLEKWAAQNPSSPMLVAAYARLGEAWLLAGERAKAKEAFQKQAELGEGGVKAMAHAALGDLQHPLIVPGGDEAQAKVHYQAALAALGAKPATDPNDIFGSRDLPYLYEQVELRLATLD
jgi:tetratricopeptide (TPR) repeat protein